MPSSVSMRRVTKFRSGEQMMSLAAVIFIFVFYGLSFEPAFLFLVPILDLSHFKISSSDWSAALRWCCLSAWRFSAIAFRNRVSIAILFRSSATFLASLGSSGLAGLQSGQRLAKPGFLGSNSKVFPHSTQVILGNAMLYLLTSFVDFNVVDGGGF